MISFITSNKGKYVEARAIIDGLEQKDLAILRFTRILWKRWRSMASTRSWPG